MHGSWWPTSSRLANLVASNSLNRNAVKPCGSRDLRTRRGRQGVETDSLSARRRSRVVRRHRESYRFVPHGADLRGADLDHAAEDFESVVVVGHGSLSIATCPF